MNAQMPLTFNEGVFLLPVAELPDDVIGRIETGDDDYALTRPQGRAGSKIIDRDSADLIGRFRQPRTIVEAVVLFSRAHNEDPQGVLESAFPMLKGLVASGYLVEVVDGVPLPRADGVLSTRWHEGDILQGGRVVRCLQVLEDSELYLLDRESRTTVFKVERGAQPGMNGPVREQLAREGGALRRLGGRIAPVFVESGEVDGRMFIEMEYCAGIDAESEAARIRERGDALARVELLALATAVATAYATLHEAGTLHGDVHPRNVLVERDGTVRIIDYGFARSVDEPATAQPIMRGGVPFFFEPELARDYLAHGAGVAPTPRGEQYAVATLIYLLMTGAHTRDFSLGREEMLREIAELPPLSFASRNLMPWRELEDVLARALSKNATDRYPDLEAFAHALADVSPDDTATADPRESGLAALSARCNHAADTEGAWQSLDSLPAPSASVNYGAAGVALGMLSMGQAREDAHSFSLAQTWLRRATEANDRDGAYYNADIEITRGTVGAASPYHSVAGLHGVSALVARAIGDVDAQVQATAEFIAASQTGHNGLDLTLGTSSSLLGAAILLDALPTATGVDPVPLVREGDRMMREIWTALDREPAIAHASIEYPGMAHGWAGFLYSAFVWCAAAGTPVPSGAERRLTELAALARPTGRGLTWPWALVGEGRHTTMPGWCNGSTGYVFLWTRAARAMNDSRYLELAIGAGWDAWDATDTSLSLCCGLAGRAYALLDLCRATADPAWRDRARLLALRGAAVGTAPPDKAHCLWKGDFGLAVLAADLEHPHDARMPFFEPVGWSGRT
ncbi:MAG: lanthionine synthetase LanC family protein [bacterium]